MIRGFAMVKRRRRNLRQLVPKKTVLVVSLEDTAPMRAPTTAAPYSGSAIEEAAIAGLLAAARSAY
jgi:hypothetical protein